MATAAPVKKLALALFSLLITLVAAEMLARAVYVKPWHLRLIEDQKAFKLKIKEGRDPYGLRMPAPLTPKASNTKRVLILGDSYTYGFGVLDDSAIFSSLLEAKLNAEFLSQDEKVEVFNGGLSGSMTHQWLELLKKTKDDFKPDVILAVFFLRDGTRLGSRQNYFDPIRKEMETRNKDSFVYRHSYLFRAIKDRFDRLRISKKYSKALHDSYFGDRTQTIEWEKAKENILKIKSIGEEVHAKVALVVFPVLVELDQEYPFKDICELIVNFGDEHHMPTHGLLPAFMDENAPDLWISSYDQHPNERGHKIAAESIFPFLKELLVSSDRS